MKIIDLLNMISKGEEVPEKIKYDNKLYTFDDKKDNYYKDETTSINWDYVALHCLNEKVEILEEEKKIPENNFNYIYSCEDEHIMANFENIKTTLKDIIDYLKSKGE